MQEEQQPPTIQPQQQDNITPTTSAPVLPPSMQAKTPKKSKKGIFIALAIFIVLLGGGATAYLLTKDKPEVATKKSVTNTEVSDTETQKSIIIPYSGTYYLQEPSETTTVYAAAYDKVTAKHIDDKNAYVTVTHPKDWAVYKKDRNQDSEDSFVGYIIQSPSGHDLHIFDQGGVGGDCPPNTESYTLTKKLPTQTANQFFTAYDAYDNGYLSLEGFGDQRPGRVVDSKHDELKEGESNTDTCNIGFYSIVLNSIMVSITSSNNDQFARKLKWDEVKGDTDFVAMLQSLKVTGTNKF